MINFKNTLVVVPARGGSKRIPQKNIKIILGVPMIYWPLEVISKHFNSNMVVVSTDSQDIVEIVNKCGLTVPFIRPQALSDDHTGTIEVVEHALRWYEANVNTVDYVLTVYPTAVLLMAEDIKRAFETLLADPDADAVMAATTFPFPIQRAVFENIHGYAQMFNPENYYKRSQDLTEALHDAGQFYLHKASIIREGKVLTQTNTRLVKLERDKVIDIDTIEDFNIAERKLLEYKKKISKFSFSEI